MARPSLVPGSAHRQGKNLAEASGELLCVFISLQWREIEMPKQNKRQPLLERNPKNDLEKVEKLYLQNYTSLFKQGIVKMDKPVINWTASRKLTKDCIEKYGVETVLDAVRKSLSNKFVVSNGYVLTTILSAGVLSQLINSTNGRIDNDVVEEEITF